jgi:hypothetical protein
MVKAQHEGADGRSTEEVAREAVGVSLEEEQRAAVEEAMRVAQEWSTVRENQGKQEAAELVSLRRAGAAEQGDESDEDIPHKHTDFCYERDARRGPGRYFVCEK